MLVILVLWTAFFVINFNVAMMIPLLPFIERDVGLSTLEAGAALAAFPIVALISNLALGPPIDRYGRKRFIVAGGSASAVVPVMTAAARSPPSIALGRAATDLFMPMIGASVFAAIADYIPPLDRPRVSGYVTSAAPIAFLCSISTGVLLGGLLTWQVPLLLLAAICLSLAAMTLALPPPKPEARSNHPISLQTYRQRLLSMSLDARTRLLLISYFCWSAGMYVFLGLYPTWLVQHGLSDHGVSAIGLMLFLGEIGGLLGAVPSGRLASFFRHPLTLSAIASLVIATTISLPRSEPALCFSGGCLWDLRIRSRSDAGSNAGRCNGARARLAARQSERHAQRSLSDRGDRGWSRGARGSTGFAPTSQRTAACPPSCSSLRRSCCGTSLRSETLCRRP
jgi:predicted MFS family arabinose efflux permease